MRRKIKPTKKNLQSIGNELRKNNNPSFLAKTILDEIDADFKKLPFNKIVIDSIRNDHEVVLLRHFPKFYLISVYADTETRFKRLSDENKSYSRENFDSDDSRDYNESIAYGQQVEKCNYLSDIIISNHKHVDLKVQKRKKDFFEKSKLIHYTKLIEIGPSMEFKPENHEKIMTLAYMESLFSSCLQRKVGAVITTAEGVIVSSGYNNVPPSEKACYEEYEECYRGYLKNQHSQKLKYCPSCGQKISITECPKCKSPMINGALKCSSCNEQINYKCPKCSEKVFEVFVPGGKGSVGKLLDVCRSLHAEENAILNVTKAGGGVSLKDLTLYTTTFPCTLCANKIAQVGIKRVVYNEAYTMKDADSILTQHDIKTEKFEGVKSQAFFKLYGY